MQDRNKEPVLRFGGATMAFRLEAAIGLFDRGDPPEDLVGKMIELEGPLGKFSGRVRSVEPYVDPSLGPGHWVVIA